MVPDLRNHINDSAGVLSRGSELKLNRTLDAVKKATGIELAVLTVPTTHGVPIEMASIQVTDQWKLGTAEADKGLLLLLAIKDRKIRIEVGQGLEGDLTDAQSKRIIDQSIVPLLRNGDYDSAVYVGTYQMLSAAAPGQNIKAFYEDLRGRKRVGRHRDRSNAEKAFIIFFILIIIFLNFIAPPGSRGGRGFYRGYGGGGGFGGGGFGGGGFGGGLGGGGGFSGGGASGGW